MPTQHHVYVLARVFADGRGPPVKVGITKELQSRLATIRTSCPFPIEIAHVLTLPERRWAQHIEWCFHGMAAKKRAHGEWFDVPPPAAERMIALIFEASLAHEGFGPPEIRSILKSCGVKPENFTFISPEPTEGACRTSC